MVSVSKITPCLWFPGNAADAIAHYTSIFPDSKVHDTSHYGKGMRLSEGEVLTITFELAGQRFLAINAEPLFPFTEAISLMISCETQAEIDHYWEKLLSGGGSPQRCGWLKDKFGLSWQVVPANLKDLMDSRSPGAAGRVMTALLSMVKPDIAALQRAREGRM